MLEQIERCDRALAAIRRHRPHTQLSSVRNELLSTVRGSSRGRIVGSPRASKRKCVWKHKFMCLAYCGQSKLPSSEADRDELFEAGLGEKDIEFEDVNCSPNE